MKNRDSYWRSLVTAAAGGANFDAPGGAYSFSAVLERERILTGGNIAGKRSSALLGLSIADPTGKMDDGAIMALVQEYINDPSATRYTDLRGLPGTHERLAAHLNQEYSSGGVAFTREWVQYSPGGIKRPLAEYIPTVFFDSNATLIFPAPSYGVIKDPKNNRGAQVIDVPMLPCPDNRWNMDWIKIDQLTKESSAVGKKVYLYLNVPHNPTGMTFDHTQWVRVISWAIENNVMLIVDEAYTHVRFDNDSCSVLHVPNWDKCCIVLQSVSKGWNATGLRFGLIIADPLAIKAIQAAMDVKDSGLFGPSIAAGLYCIEHMDITKVTTANYRKLHERLADGLRQSGFQGFVPGAGLCQFTKAPKSADGKEFANSAELAEWLRQEKRISLMHNAVNGVPYLRWAVTIAPVPDCGLPNELAVIDEVMCRLGDIKFEF